MTQQTLGQFRVGVSFNPSNNADVDIIKMQAAALIDTLNALPVMDGEGARLKALAMSAIEDGAMWGVKAATKQPIPEHLRVEKPFAPAPTPTPAQADPFDEACRAAAVAVMGSIGPWEKVAEGWQIMDMLDRIHRKGFTGIHIADVYATLDKIRGQK
jgi:hypothetical protein